MVAINIQNNSVDPENPLYLTECWKEARCHWQQTLDWTGDLGRTDFKKKYLNRAGDESGSKYDKRVARTSPEPYFKDACRSHASLFSQTKVNEKAPASFLEYLNDVDGTGVGLEQWAFHPIYQFYRDGGSLMGVGISGTVNANGQAEAIRPYLEYVPLLNLSAVEYSIHPTTKLNTFSRVVINRVITESSTGSAKFRLIEYKINDQGYCEQHIYETELSDLKSMVNPIEIDSIDLDGARVKMPRIINDASGNPMIRLPFTDKLSVISSLEITEQQPIVSNFASILELSKEHYNARSEYDSNCRTVALVTPTRGWPDGIPEPNKRPPFKIGSENVIEYDARGNVGWHELEGKSLTELRQRYLDIENKIKIRDNKLFYVEGNASNRTATEALIENQKAKAESPSVANIIQSAFQDLFQIWELRTNRNPQTVSGIDIADDVLAVPMTSDDALAIVTAGNQLLSLPPQTRTMVSVRKLIRAGYYTVKDFGVESMQELEQLINSIETEELTI